MSNYQGSLDGLCGPYAIVNAFEHCGIHRPGELFETACMAISQRRWPKILWDGTSLGDVKRMIKLCRELTPDAAKVQISYPFIRKAPTSNKEYWDRIDEIVADRPNFRCMIIGLTRPRYHWIVAHLETPKRLSFIDTDPHKSIRIKNRSQLYAGYRNKNSKKWMIDRSELILFEVGQ